MRPDSSDRQQRRWTAAGPVELGGPASRRAWIRCCLYGARVRASWMPPVEWRRRRRGPQWQPRAGFVAGGCEVRERRWPRSAAGPRRRLATVGLRGFGLEVLSAPDDLSWEVAGPGARPGVNHPGQLAGSPADRVSTDECSDPPDGLPKPVRHDRPVPAPSLLDGAHVSSPRGRSASLQRQSRGTSTASYTPSELHLCGGPPGARTPHQKLKRCPAPLH